MKGKFASTLAIVVILSLLASTVLAGCATQEPEEPTQQVKATEAKATEPPAAAQVVNSLGIELPADAAPIEEQVIRIPTTEETWLTWDASVYDVNSGSYVGWGDSCVRPDKDYNPQPAGCKSWKVSDDGLTWTFYLPEDKIWSDDTPVTAEDWVFTLLHYARPDYDFQWFYSMANIVNWKKVSRGELPPEELGAKVVDDYTFTVTTTQPTPYLIKIFADLWVVPKHIVKDWQNDGSWALDKNNWISCNSFIIDAWDKGKQLVFVANKKYTGPYPPMVEKVTYIFIEPEVRWTAYKNDELDYIGGGYEQDLPPSAMAEIMANPELNEQLIAWPNFITYYLFFDTWNPPFDNLQVRQAFSHAIDRDALIEGPLKYQAVSAYSMNPPGFPGESVEELKSVQNYDPELAAELLAKAGYTGGEGFPKLTMNLRNAFPALINAAEAIAAMLKENLGVDVEIQDLEYSIFTEGYRNQKKNKGGDFIFALVPYEFDFVDGSNLLSVWGGCEEEGETDLSNMPGRHTWYNKEYNDLNCQAGAILGDEAKRNELYRQAEQILIEDVAMVPIYHAILSAMVRPDIAGPMFEPDSKGMVTWHRFRFASREALIYRTKSE